MKITRITTRLVPPRSALVKIECDDGCVGWGEPTLEGHARTACTAVEQFARQLIGENPLRIEHLYQVLYRGNFYRGGPLLTSAISGLEQALWDICGKVRGAPIYELLGGPVRDRIRMYVHGGGRTPAEAAASALKAKEAGFTCLKTGMTPHPPRLVDTPAVADEVAARLAAMRDAVGADFDLAIDCHGRLSPAMAVRLCDAVEPMRPLWVEEPLMCENIDALALVYRKVRVPLATGERLYTRHGFRPLLEAGACDILQPDVSHAGGILECRKIAAMGEAYYLGFAPHSPLGPVALAACVQVDAATPNFLIQEHTAASLGEGLLKEPLRITDGYLELPTGPGLGIEIDEDKLAELGEHDWLTPQTRAADDGSVTDW